MEIKRIGENKFRCALTQQEICDLGFDIDEIIENSETTQRFMREVLSLVEEQEHINIEEMSPMVKAELLQNHSMAITFGADSEISLKELMNTMSHIMSQIEPERFEELREAAEKKNEKKQESSVEKDKEEPMICALRFGTFQEMQNMSHVCFPDRLPKSSLYKIKEKYYLILNFAGFTKEEMRPFAFGAVEYDDGHYSDMAQIAHIMEQGTRIMKSEALEMLMQL